MTNEEALKKFETALNLFGTPELVEFHKEIAVSDLPLSDANFWMCLCNDFEDLKFAFFKSVENFISSGETSRANWVNNGVIEFPESISYTMPRIKGTRLNEE